MGKTSLIFVEKVYVLIDITMKALTLTVTIEGLLIQFIALNKYSVYLNSKIFLTYFNIL